MPRQPAQHIKPRKYCRTEFHPDAEEYLKDLADDVGVEVAYIIRLCVKKSLPEIEATLRSGELPHDELKKPSKPLKTTLRKPRPTPNVSKEPPPLIAVFAETGVMPPDPPAPAKSAEPETEPEPIERRQEPDGPAEPPAPPVSPHASDRPDAGPTPSEDPLQRKLQRVGKMRRG